MSKLRELISEATPGPWFKEVSHCNDCKYWFAVGPTTESIEQAGADTALIDTLVNAAKEISGLMDAYRNTGSSLAVIEALQALDKKLGG